MLAAEEEWRGDFVSDIHQERKTMTKNSISHYVKREVKRRVSSFSSSEQIFITDCCWASFPGLQSFIFFGLSNGCVCLLNTANLLKTYLFREPEKDSGHELKGHHTRDLKGERPKVEQQRPMQLVAVDCAPLDAGSSIHPLLSVSTSTSTATIRNQRCILCVILDGWVQLCHIDNSTSTSELRRPPRGLPSKMLELPRDIQQNVLIRQVRFSPSADRISVFQTYLVNKECVGEEARKAVVSSVTVLKREVSSLASGYLVEFSWRQVQPPRGFTTHTDLIRFWGWWDEESFLCVWSSGWLQLLRVKDLTILSETRLLPSARTHSLLLVTATPCTASSVVTECRPVAAEARMFFLAVALENNVVMTFNVNLVETEARQEASGKMGEDTFDFEKRARTLIIKQTQKTFYTEDIPVSSLALFHVHSWTLCMGLESGAVLFIDAMTMDLLVHRALKREGSAFGAQTWGDRGYVTNRPSFSCLPLGKPLNVVVWDHNMATILKP
ncbi:unnamed protein product [Phytomonas sp. EM1]|nr:unnamed protein product [Phytomonas sp. EM1]|eukprot:CCW61033.1 unnamed protein product [Phytomonas sp. isolate EM1]